MKILVLCDRYPYPLEQGLNLRIYNFIKYLPNNCQCDLVCYGDTDPPSKLQEIFNNIYPFPTPSPKYHSNIFHKLWGLIDPRNLELYSSDIATSINSIITNNSYDIILSTTGMIPYISPDLPIPVVVDVIDDAVLELWRDFKVAKSLKERLRSLLYLFQNYLFEKIYLSNRYVDACFFTSEVDANVFRKICPNTHTRVIQNGVDSDFYSPDTSEPEPNTIVFEGNMSFPPNVDGAIYFCNEIFPIILKKIPSVKLLLVGKSPVTEVKNLASNNVIVTGFVDDVRPYLRSASVFVCPLRKGGGIKNKILQAWSIGKACVATSYSTGGLNAIDGENIIIRDSSSEFANAVVELLLNLPMQVEIGHNARLTIENYYTWKNKSNDLYDLLKYCLKDNKNS